MTISCCGSSFHQLTGRGLMRIRCSSSRALRWPPSPSPTARAAYRTLQALTSSSRSADSTGARGSTDLGCLKLTGPASLRSRFGAEEVDEPLAYASGSSPGFFGTLLDLGFRQMPSAFIELHIPLQEQRARADPVDIAIMSGRRLLRSLQRAQEPSAAHD